MAFSSISDLKTARNQALSDSDYWMLPDAVREITPAMKLYREKLRDITIGVTEENVGSVELPAKPFDN
tara:strand:+ start:1652 stop:1855 length:204 start_codon:yes stop_codon:yes gene_type:complete